MRTILAVYSMAAVILLGNAECRSAVIPVSFTIDSTRSSIAWSANFSLGTLPVTLQEVSPGSLVSTVQGGFAGSLDSSTDVMNLSPGPQGFFQPDTQSYEPSISLGKFSSIGGKIGILGVVEGFLSIREANYYFNPFSIADFQPQTLPINGPWTSLPTPLVGAGVDVVFDYSLSGLVNTAGSIATDLSPLNRELLTSYRRTGPNSFEIKFDVDRPALPNDVITLGGLPINVSANVKGTIIATFVPEVGSFGLMGLVMLIAVLTVTVQRNRPSRLLDR